MLEMRREFEPSRGIRDRCAGPRAGIARRTALAAALVAAALAAPVPATSANAQHPHPQHKEEMKRQVEKLEETWRVAQLNDDLDTMDRLLSDDYVGITMNGQVVTKTQQLDRMRTRTVVVTKIDLEDVKVKLIGSTAVVTSLANVEGTSEGEPMHGDYRYTRVYSRLPNGTWKITNFEATRVGEPGGGRRARGLEPPSSGQGAAAQSPQKFVARNE